MSGVLHAQFPSGPIIDRAGNLTPAWRAFLLQLYARTGGAAVSATTPQLAAGLAAEVIARTNADDDLTAALAAEQEARGEADASEAAIRAAADKALLPIAGGTMTGTLRGPAASFTLYQVGGAGGPTWTAGWGVPTGAQPVGSLYSRRDGAAGSTLYVFTEGEWNAIALAVLW